MEVNKIKYTLFSGCVSHQSCPELLKSTTTVLEAIEIDLVDTEGFSCCGAGYLNVSSEDLSVAVNARNFALAKKTNSTIITPCSTCYLSMKKVEQALENPILKDGIDQILKKYDLDFQMPGKVLHLVEVMTEEKISNLIQFPLNNLKVAPFYGCHLIRPKNFKGAQRMDALIERVGADLVRCETSSKCCGFHIMMEHENTMKDMAGEFLTEATKRGADLVVTSCPLCQMVFDLFQSKISKKVKNNFKIPVLHMSQLVGLAIGAGEKKVDLGRNIVSPKKLFSKEIRKGNKN